MKVDSLKAMAGKNFTQNFEMQDSILKYDPAKSTLLCVNKYDGTGKKWIKKLIDITCITNVLEDNKRYYIACESGDINGQFIALSKGSGSTDWFIPGKSFLHVLFDGFLYLIFVDEDSRYYLLKVNRNNGRAAWHHRVEQDLYEYSFSGKEARLVFSSGRKEYLSLKTGRLV